MKEVASIGTPVNVKMVQEEVAEMTGASVRSVCHLTNKLDSIESGTSA
jgi:hypothetical protein